MFEGLKETNPLVQEIHIIGKKLRSLHPNMPHKDILAHLKPLTNSFEIAAVLNDARNSQKMINYYQRESSHMTSIDSNSFLVEPLCYPYRETADA